MPEDFLAYPEWSEYKKKGGLDPLGMQNSSINLYQRLLPGISNVTLRVRYYGLYAWLALIYAQRIGDTNPKTWQRFVRRAEAVYALTAQRRGNEGGVAGVLWAQRKMEADQGSVIEFASHSDPGADGTPYLQQAWGAYGAAYASQLFEIGVYAVAKEHDIPVPSPELGEPLARSFEEAAGPLADRFFETVHSGSVSRADLDAFSPLTPSTINGDSVERQLYEDMLFAKRLRRPTDISRSQTLLLLLHVASHLTRTPNVAEARWLLYAGADENNQTLSVSDPALSEQKRRWWVYQANDLLHYSYETLLKYGLDTLESYPAGIALNVLISELVSDLSEAEQSWPDTWKSFLTDIPLAQNANDGSDPNSERSLVDSIAPTSGSSQRTTREAAWAALKLLAVVENRVQTGHAAISTELGHLDTEGFHSLVTETSFLSGGKNEQFARMVARIIEERVIKRHLWVAHRKFRYYNDYTFLIEVDDGRVRLRAENGPVLTNPRLGPSITFLQDLHLINEHGATARGDALLEAL
ncbi:MAG TPA: hypothetical protein VKG91_19425 [Roseiarcus sp.]|nr:hypothetical protein [Roseiarcus sp.]